MESKMTKNEDVKETAKVKNEKSVADKVWDSIKNLRLEMFGLPNQYVHMYFEPTKFNLDPNRAYLLPKTKATSVLPALEVALGTRYEVSQAKQFIIISKVENFEV